MGGLLEQTLERVKILAYFLGGRIPGSNGYRSYREEYIRRVLADPERLAEFRSGRSLPKGYGNRLDERVIEYPWAYARLSSAATQLLDAGAALNHKLLLEQPKLAKKTLVIYTLAPSKYERLFSLANVSYLFGDLRNTILADNVFEEAVCISTVEHIGMDNTLFYTRNEHYLELRVDDYIQAVKELRRLLAPNGRLLITVPFGRAQNLGWLQQFDRAKIERLVNAFGGALRDQAYYKYNADGWQIADSDACANCEYHDMHANKRFAPDYAAAARAVACLELQK